VASYEIRAYPGFDHPPFRHDAPTWTESPNIDIVSKQALVMQLNKLLGRLTEAGCYSRIVSSDVLEGAQDGVTSAEAEDMTMDNEIEGFLETDEWDEYQQHRKVSVLANLQSPRGVVTLTGRRFTQHLTW
jgi:hypothetical protein